MHRLTPENLFRAFSRPKHIKLLGDERGDRAAIERVPIVTGFALTSASPVIINNQLPRGNVWLGLRINLRGQLVGAGSASGTVLPDAPLSLFSLALNTDLDGDIIEPSISARALYRYAQFMHGTIEDLVAPTVTSSTTTDFNAVVFIPFADPLLINPVDSALDTRRYESIQLTITSGVIGDIVSSPTNVTLGNLFADVEIVRISPEVAPPQDLVQLLPHYKRYAPIIPGTDTTLRLDRNPILAIKRLMAFASTGSTAGVPYTGTGSNGVIDTVSVISDKRQHHGGPAGGVSFRTLRSANKLDYSIETWPTGWHVIDWVLDGSINSSLPTGDKSNLDLVFTFQSTASTPQISVMQAAVRQLRELRA